MKPAIIASLACLALLSAPAFAEPAVTGEAVSAEILTGWRDADGHHVAALHLTLAEGWKTYWRAPGDAGIPPRFDVTGGNLADMRTIWPRPNIYSVAGMRTVGYSGELILPLHVTPENTAEPIELQGTVEIGICRDVCVPARLEFAAQLPADGQSDARIVAALVDVPFTSDEAGVQSVTCSFAPVQYGLGLFAELQMPRIGAREIVVVESDDSMVWVSEAEATREGDTLSVQTVLSHVEKDGFTVDPEGLRFTVLTDGMAVDIQGCAAR